MRAVDKRRNNPNAELSKDENNLIFAAWWVQSKPEILKVDEANEGEGAEAAPIFVEPVIQEVGFGHKEPDRSAETLVGDQGWVDMCKSDILGVLFQTPSKS